MAIRLTCNTNRHRNVTVLKLLPALPLDSSWASGGVKSARIRDGVEMDFEWERSAVKLVRLKGDSIVGDGRMVKVLEREVWVAVGREVLLTF